MPTNTVQDRALLAGLTKNRQGRIQWLDTTVPVGLPGQFTEINLVGFTVTFSGTRLTITGSGGGGGVQTINTISPDGSGDFSITSADTSVTITPIANGIDLSVSGGSYTPPVTTKGDLFGFSTVPDRVPVGTNGQVLKADSTQPLGVAYADVNAGLSFRIGRQDGAVLLANFQRVFILPCSYDELTTGSWELYTYPGSTCAIDIQYIAFGTSDPTTANSIVGGVHPATSGGQTATGLTSGWSPSSIAQGGFLAIQVISNDLAREIRFFMPGRKVI